MDWEHVRTHVESQISYWRAVGKQDWAEVLESAWPGQNAARACRTPCSTCGSGWKQNAKGGPS
jgi:hypothetical protein